MADTRFTLDQHGAAAKNHDSSHNPEMNDAPHVVRSRRMFLAAIAVAAILRTALVGFPICIDRNGVQLVEFAKRMADDPIAAMKLTTRQPAYSWLLLKTHQLIGPLAGGDTPEAWQRCGEFIAMLGGLAVCIAIWAVTRRLFDDRIAAFAAVLAACWPQGVTLSAGVLSDMPHLAVFLGAMLLIIDGCSRRSIGRLAAGGAMAGIAYLFKQEAISLLAGGLIAWWMSSRSEPIARRLGGAAAFAVVFAMAVSPHSIATGALIPNKNPMDILRLVATPQSDANNPILAYAVPWWQTPGRFLEDWLRSGRYVIPLLFLAGAFLKQSATAQREGRTLVVATIATYIVLIQARSILYGEISERYAAIPGVLAIPWAAAGWCALADRLNVRNPRWVTALGALLLLPLVAYSLRPVAAPKSGFREAGARLRAAAAADDRVLAHEHLEQIMFYAGRTYPDTTWIKCRRSDASDRIRRYIRGKRPAWYVDAESTHRGALDETRHFAWLRQASDLFEPLTEAGPEGNRVFVYRIRTANAAR
ncbi:MAG: glycosyltransferase family 39 protein [Phycisphaerae bacterium]|nr:glycosyltransferase family 39 protein [Phycisphaerae bacterium]